MYYLVCQDTLGCFFLFYGMENKGGNLGKNEIGVENRGMRFQFFIL